MNKKNIFVFECNECGKLYVIENVCEDLDSKITNLKKEL